MTEGLCMNLWKRFMSELWGFFALSGLLCLHTGILLTVYAIKEVTSHSDVVQAVGGVLILFGLVGIVFSWFFHRQQRERRPLCPWSERLCPCCACCDSHALGLDGSLRGSDRFKANQGEPETPSVFSTPEFRRYSAFLKQGTAGVEKTPEQIHKSYRKNKTPGEASRSKSPSISSTGSLTFSAGPSFVRVNPGQKPPDITSVETFKAVEESGASLYI